MISEKARRATPYAFTEQRVAMLSSVLRSERAIAVNIEIMRAFVRTRRLLLGKKQLTRRLDDLERRYDEKFRAVFDAIRALVQVPVAADKPPIGFSTEQEKRQKPGGLRKQD